MISLTTRERKVLQEAVTIIAGVLARSTEPAAGKFDDWLRGLDPDGESGFAPAAKCNTIKGAARRLQIPISFRYHGETLEVWRRA
jgi:hypothetical protein